MSDHGKMATNISVRACVDSILDIMGENGAKVIFRSCGHPHFSEQPPPYNWEPCISVSEQAMLYAEVARLVGLNGAASIWRRIGYTACRYASEKSNALDQYAALDPDEKFKKGIETYTFASGKGKIVDNGGKRPDFDVMDCDICTPYKADRSICTAFGGVVQFFSDWAYGKDAFVVKETKCKAKGDETCYFTLVSPD